MSTVVSITQPTYLPWLGYFNLVAKSDVFIFLDTVQFEKQSWQCRNRIRTKKGEIKWLSVPIKKHNLDTAINEIEIENNKQVWRRKHLLTLEQNLGKTPYYKEVQNLYENILCDKNYKYLADMNIKFISNVARSFGLKTKMFRASDLEIPGNQSQLLLNICNYFDADQFYCNAGSAVYLESSRAEFKCNGVEIVYQDWKHPVYEQSGDEFTSHLSCVDAIACMGIALSSQKVKE